MAIGTPVTIGSNAATGINSATLVLTTTAAVSAGDQIVVLIYVASNSIAFSSVTDSVGNTYTIDAMKAHTSSARRIGIASARAATTLPLGGTITLTIASSSSANKGIAAVSVSGLEATGYVDATSTNEGTGTGWSTGSSGTLAQADEIAIACAYSGTTTANAPAGAWLELYDFTAGSQRNAMEYQIVAATTALDAGGTWGNSNWAGVLATYKGVSANVTVPAGAGDASASGDTVAVISPISIAADTGEATADGATVAPVGAVPAGAGEAEADGDTVDLTSALNVTVPGSTGAATASGDPVIISRGVVISPGGGGGWASGGPSTKAAFEVRITPLMRGIAGELENVLQSHNPAGSTVIELDDTTLVTQYLDLEVTHELSEPRSGRVVLSIHDPIVATLEPWAQAVWIGYRRPRETLAEAILWGQCNVVTDYEAQTVTLDIQDPALRCRRHFIRIGDEALNLDDNRGTLPSHAYSISTILDAARNIPVQQDRGVPVLGIADYHDYYTLDIDDADPLNFERGQECWGLIEQIVRDVRGPDFDMHPMWFFPSTGYYCRLWTYDPADPPPAVTGTMLARDLDPADPDNPGIGEVIFDYGTGLDNVKGLVEEPNLPTTHAHVLDEPAAYRETSADADSSYDVGIFVDWIATGFAIQRPTRAAPVANTGRLRGTADAHIKAYGRPAKHLTITLDPDDAQQFHYGHPEWGSAVPSGVEWFGGDWYIGDYVRVRGVRGHRSVNTLNRITKASFKYDLDADLVKINVELIPALGGTPGDSDETETAGGDVTPPSVAFTAPADLATISGTTVAISATASDDVAVAHVEFLLDGVAITPGGWDLDAPYAVTFDSTTTTDGTHTLTARATDTSGNIATATITVTTDNGIAPPPPPPPPPPGSNLVYIDGRRIRNVSDDENADLRGGNVHVGDFAFSQADFDSMAAQGWNCIRLCAQWDDIETSPGVFNATQLGHVHTSIQRAETAGLKVILCQGINSPNWGARFANAPAWSYASGGPATPVAPWTGAYLFHVFMSHGEAYSRKMVQEFSPYENVIGFDPWNEPDSTSASIVQQGMNEWLGWVRDEPAGEGKLWFITNLYSSQSAAAAFNDWGQIANLENCVLQLHTYYAPKSPTASGWTTDNGMRDTWSGAFWNGSIEANAYSTANKAALRIHLATWKQASQALGVPVILGEAGVQHYKATALQRQQWGLDMVEAAELEEFAGVFWWIYATSAAQDDWTARLSGPWRPEAAAFGTFESF